MGSRPHAPRLAPPYSAFASRAPARACWAASRRCLALAAGGRAGSAAPGAAASAGTVSHGPAQARTGRRLGGVRRAGMRER